jgi:hypothetical protein
LNTHAAWEVDPEILPWRKDLGSPRPAIAALVFSSFEKAVEVALYNAVLLCLLGLLWSFRDPEDDSLWSDELANCPLLPPGRARSLVGPAVEICQAFEFQQAHVKGNQQSVLFWLFPLGLANSVLEDSAEYTAWIQRLLEMSQVTRGYGRGRNTAGFGFYKLPKVSPKKVNVRPTTTFRAPYDSESLTLWSKGISLPG